MFAGTGCAPTVSVERGVLEEHVVEVLLDAVLKEGRTTLLAHGCNPCV